jgi:uncharacterized protein (TIGR03083 family)
MALETADDARRVINLLRGEYQRLTAYLDTLGPADWEAPSYCADWRVYQVVSHLGSGPEITRGGLAQALSGGPEYGDAERRAVWASFDALPPGEVYPAYRQTNDAFLDFLNGLDGQQLGAQVPYFAGGTVPLAVLLAARLSEATLHTWDLLVMRDPRATLTSGNRSDVLEHNKRSLGRGLKTERAGQLSGKLVEFQLSHPSDRLGFAIAEPFGGVQAGPVLNPDLSVQTTTEAFLRLIWNRLGPPAAPPALELSRPEWQDDLLAAFPGR